MPTMSPPVSPPPMPPPLDIAPLDIAPLDWITPSALTETHPAVVAWQAHVDAGRLGRRCAADPAIVANRARTAALFAGIRR